MKVILFPSPWSNRELFSHSWANSFSGPLAHSRGAVGEQACRVAWVKLVCDSHPGKSQERERCGGRGVTCCDKSYRGLNLRPVDSWHTSSAMGAQDWRSVVFLGSVSSGFPIIPKTDGNQTVHVTSFEDPEKQVRDHYFFLLHQE